MFDEDVIIKIDLHNPQEINFGEKEEGKKKRQKVDEYDYEDDFIEPFEGELQPVMIECNIDDFFIYKGQLPYNSKRVLSVHKAREEKKKKLGENNVGEEKEIKEKDKVQSTNGEKINIQEIVKNIESVDLKKKGKKKTEKIVEVSTNEENVKEETEAREEKTIKKERKAGEKNKEGKKSTQPKEGKKIPKDAVHVLEYMRYKLKKLKEQKELTPKDKLKAYAYAGYLRPFNIEEDKDLIIFAPKNLTEIGENLNKYIEEIDADKTKLFELLSDTIYAHDLYVENYSLFRGFDRRNFTENSTEYVIASLILDYIKDSSTRVNLGRKKAIKEIQGQFSDNCRNSSRVNTVINKYIETTEGVSLPEDEKVQPEDNEQ